MKSVGADEDLSKPQLDELRTALEALVHELQDTARDAGEAARPVELDQQSVGRVSRIDAIQQQQVAAEGKRSAELRLSGVRTALRAMDEGTYGECRACDEPIGYRRLHARPDSPLCLTCQDARERT